MGRAAALQNHPQCKAAKACDSKAAKALVNDLVRPEDIEQARERLPQGAIYVALHAEEAAGNKIPVALADRYASELAGSVATEIVQTNETHHTGSRAMNRLVTRPEFDGPVEPGKSYVLVDDVVTLGGTLAEAANYIESKGGKVAGAIVLANASRTGTLAPKREDHPNPGGALWRRNQRIIRRRARRTHSPGSYVSHRFQIG